MAEQQTTTERVPTCVYCGCRLEFLYHSEDLCMTCGDALESLGKGKMIRVMAGRLKCLLAECRAAVAEERERCLRIVKAQPYYPDTHTGTRQQWVKDQIAEAIERGQ